MTAFEAIKHMAAGCIMRVKPEPRKPRVVWINEYQLPATGNGTLGCCHFDSREQAMQNSGDNNVKPIRFVEDVKDEGIVPPSNPDPFDEWWSKLKLMGDRPSDQCEVRAVMALQMFLRSAILAPSNPGLFNPAQIPPKLRLQEQPIQLSCA